MKVSMRSRVMCGTVALVGVVLVAFVLNTSAGDDSKKDPEPPVVNPGPVGGPPSDATVLFDGQDRSQFRGERSPEPQWKLENGCMETTPQGGVFSKQEFTDCQLHVEWAAPSAVKGEGQGRGNSGVYLMGRYEIQVLDCYDNKTYPNGQCGAFYGHNAPLVNACRQPGEWQAYDIIFHAPKKLADGKVQPGSFTVLHNGVLIQDHVPVGAESTTAAPLQGLVEKGPLYLQDHGNPVRYRNVWIRPL
ncbi:MAG: 3-keto-disaccharide hydrolase [Pirellulaceae bacterium]